MAIDSLYNQGKKVKFHWILTYQEIKKNKLVDSVAKQAARQRKKRKKMEESKKAQWQKINANLDIAFTSQANLDLVIKV